jgi:hypothetical protein
MLMAIVVPACALEADMADDPEHQDGQGGPGAQEDPPEEQAAEDATGTAESDILATPTCNTVVNWSNAAVPAWSGSGTVNCNMVRGTNSAAVRQLQRSMNVCYGEALRTDGDFGGLTEAALRRTQARSGAQVDGQYGPNTRTHMKHEGNEVPGPGGCHTVP